MEHGTVKFLVMDVDGTLTDGKIYMGMSGEIFKAFDIKDGYGIHEILPQYSITPVIITGRKTEIVQNRCEELGITSIYQGYHDKLPALLEATENELSSAAYIGDDILDLRCMELIKQAGGIVGCPADAVKEIKEISDFVSSKNGGNGAVREFIEWLIHADSI